ncbi:MAG: WbuC family cupin fold metalloprotein [Vallitalea sp.]|jgi:cupin fold WbuC family metalloprotein|nr:WbuC family cupin fold metalloprotein [Vallitalea sp.]
MKIIDEKLLDEVSIEAKSSPRKRMNYNFHEDIEDPVNRMLNALEVGTYLPPHRHHNPDKAEIFLVLRGKIAVYTFDELGEVLTSQIVSPKYKCYGVEIPPCTWHSLVVLEEDTVIYEIKEGPYQPLGKDNLAPWGPNVQDKNAIALFQKKLINLIIE